MSRSILGVSIVLFFACVAGCSSDETLPVSAEAPSKSTVPSLSAIDVGKLDFAPTQTAAASNIRFVDRHEELGVSFSYDNGSDERSLMVQSTGGGGGWMDFDADSWPDLVLVQGGNPTADPPHETGDRTFRNVRGGKFNDVTDSVLPPDRGFGQGMAVGDFNEDGFDDLFITNVTSRVLLLNCGDGTFTDVTQQSGTNDERWGSSAAWADLDLDGDLDLFVCNYCRYDVRNPVVCRKPDGTPGICHPESLDASYSECFENLGDGRFASAAKKWGLAEKPGKALGIVAADFNLDRLPDLFVANDTMANFMYLGEPGGGFTEQAIELGCAYNVLGQYQANMGVACNDYDGNGYPDLYITTFTDDSNTLFANLGPGGFRDVTRQEGLHSTTIETLGFGTVMTDLDADGAMDLFIANGHIDDWRYKNELWKMKPELFSYSEGMWTKLTASSVGPYLAEEYLGRAVSMADFDHDGDSDLLVVHQNEPAALLVNESVTGHWLRVECSGRISNRRGFGAKVTVQQGDRKWTQQLISGSSYLTSHEPVLFFGLGASNEPCEVSVEWPNSDTPAITQNVNVNQRIRMTETSRLSSQETPK